MTRGDVFIHSAVIKIFQLYTQHSTDPDPATRLWDTYLNGAHGFQSPAINWCRPSAHPQAKSSGFKHALNKDGAALPPSVSLGYKISGHWWASQTSNGKCFLLLRYEDEINRRTECENDFVLIKKVSILQLTESTNYNILYELKAKKSRVPSVSCKILTFFKIILVFYRM